MNPSNTTKEGHSRLNSLAKQWTTEPNDAFLYAINNGGKQEWIPVTDIVGALPHHPFVYYTAKYALKVAIWDSEKSINDYGRTTDIPPTTEGLNQVTNMGTKAIKPGRVVITSTVPPRSLKIIDGNTALPLSLSSPLSSWRSIIRAFQKAKAVKEEEVRASMKRYANEQKYIGVERPFSCMEYRLDMYLKRSTVK